MSVKTFFEKIGTDIGDIFKKAFSATWEQKVLSTVAYVEPFIDGILSLADPAIEPLVSKVVAAVVSDLTTVKTVVSQGTVAAGSTAAQQVTAALTSIQTMVRIICGRFVTGCDWISAKPDRPWMIGS